MHRIPKMLCGVAGTSEQVNGSLPHFKTSPVSKRHVGVASINFRMV